jgi:hypothetical protein
LLSVEAASEGDRAHSFVNGVLRSESGSTNAMRSWALCGEPAHRVISHSGPTSAIRSTRDRICLPPCTVELTQMRHPQLRFSRAMHRRAVSWWECFHKRHCFPSAGHRLHFTKLWLEANTSPGRSEDLRALRIRSVHMVRVRHNL